MNPTVVIVDPFSSGRHLAPCLREKHAVNCVAVLSSENLPSFYLNSLQRSDFTEVITFTDEVSLLKKLRTANVLAVIAGSEPGVLLADRLSESLDLRRNQPALSAARRNKYLMLEAIRSQGLPAAKQFLASDAESALNWIKNHLSYPIVLKPKDSAGTDGVALAKNEGDVAAYFQRYLNAENMLTLKIDQILVQEFLEGTEYVVDTVSHDGQTEVVAVWRYHKAPANGSEFVYDTMRLLLTLTAEERGLVSYTLQCLKALGIENGPAHSEVMLTATGPSLIEVGARIHGGNGTLISGQCVGYNQIDRTALLYANPSEFRASSQPLYVAEKSALEIFLISPTSGRFKSLHNESFIRGLPTFHGLTFGIKPGEPLVQTTDLFSSPGRVILIGSPEQIERDYQAVRDWENRGAYVVE